jgi:2-isopropylmalate synthase
VSRFVYELANLEPDKRQAFVGQSAFAHKGGLHVAAVKKNRETYEHIDPAAVGNAQRVLVSDLSGRSNLLAKAEQFGLDLSRRPDAVQELLGRLKDLEARGYAYEGAEASFELLMRHALEGSRPRFFRLIGFRVIDEKRRDDEPSVAEATIILEGPNGEIEHTAAQGNGPVNALDGALRKALTKFYPEVEEVVLHDYKVRVLGGAGGTAAVVRVLVESGDRRQRWGTVGVSENVIEASWQALADAMDYKLYHSKRRRRSAAPRRTVRRRA